jgi:LytS/YehU family sensor histidine kinase
MILQLHSENAVKHGLRPKGIGGRLEINILRREDYLEITVKDNGVGRKATTSIKSQSTGKGMKILEQLYETYNKFNSKPITQEVIDIEDEQGKPAGTLVKIKVPVEFNETIYN